jgi:glycosyltransferase involved in cell wall biosynthesis
MNILIIHNSYIYPGGEETYVQSLKKLLESKGNNVYVYIKDNKKIKTLKDKLTVGLGLFWNRKIEKELDAIIKDFKPDIAQFQNVFPSISLSAYWSCKNNNIPIVQRVSNYRFVCPKSSLFRNGKICDLCMRKGFFYPSVVYRCYNNSFVSSFILAISIFYHKYIAKSFSLVNMYVFPSNFTRRLISKYFPINHSKTQHIPTFTSISRSNITRTANKKYFVYAGRLSEEKGLLKLLSIFSTPKFKKCNLYIAGNGPLRNEVKNACLKNTNILYEGELTQKKLSFLIANSIGLVLPAIWYDVQPNIILEALSLGVPVIVPNTTVFSELVYDKLNGLVYKTNKGLGKNIISIWSKNIVFDPQVIKNSLPINKPREHYKRLMRLYNTLIESKNEK